MDICYEKGRIIDVDCTYDDGKFILGCLPGCLPTLCTVRFRAPADYTAGDAIVVKKLELPVKTPGMVDAPDGLFKAEAIVHCDLDMDRELAFLSLGGSGGGNGGTGTHPDMSYDEQYAGFHAEDGKKVYMKSVAFGNLPNNDTKRVAHGIANMFEIIDIKARWGKAIRTHSGNLTHAGRDVFYGCTNTEVYCTVDGWDMSLDTAVVTLYYTCTDR